MVASWAALGSIAWVVLLVTAPVVPAWAGGVLYTIGSLVCHQIPERSFYVAGFQLPVCARCLGIYLGAASGVAAAVAWARGGRAVRIRSKTARVLAAVAAVPTLATVALEMAGWWFPANVTRAMAGLPFGAIAGVVAANALASGPPPRTSAPTPAPFDRR